MRFIYVEVYLTESTISFKFILTEPNIPLLMDLGQPEEINEDDNGVYHILSLIINSLRISVNQTGM